MKNILEEIAARTRERIAKEKSCISVSELENRIQEVNKNAGKRITLLQALQKDGMSYICEVKKASPSKGLIAPDFPYDKGKWKSTDLRSNGTVRRWL